MQEVVIIFYVVLIMMSIGTHQYILYRPCWRKGRKYAKYALFLTISIGTTAFAEGIQAQAVYYSPRLLSYLWIWATLGFIFRFLTFSQILSLIIILYSPNSVVWMTDIRVRFAVCVLYLAFVLVYLGYGTLEIPQIEVAYAAAIYTIITLSTVIYSVIVIIKFRRIRGIFDNDMSEMVMNSYRLYIASMLIYLPSLGITSGVMWYLVISGVTIIHEFYENYEISWFRPLLQIADCTGMSIILIRILLHERLSQIKQPKNKTTLARAIRLGLPQTIASVLDVFTHFDTIGIPGIVAIIMDYVRSDVLVTIEGEHYDPNSLTYLMAKPLSNFFLESRTWNVLNDVSGPRYSSMAYSDWQEWHGEAEDTEGSSSLLPIRYSF